MPSCCALEVAEVGGELVGCAVEAPDLAVEHVDEAPEQALALVGELEPVRCDALRDDAEGFAHRVECVVAVTHVAGVELVALGGRADQRRILADGRGDGLRAGLGGVGIECHDDLPVVRCTLGADPRCDGSLGHARATKPRGVGGAWRRVGASGAGAGPYRSLGLRNEGLSGGWA